MDTSAEYIKQCEKAKEIQDLIKNKRLSFYFRHTYDKKRRRLSVCQTGKAVNAHLWIPRQDQLQKIMFGDIGHISFFIDSLTSYLFDYSDTQCPRFDFDRKFGSMEQLWLGFVMSERYHKKWDGNDWVNQ